MHVILWKLNNLFIFQFVDVFLVLQFIFFVFKMPRSKRRNRSRTRSRSNSARSRDHREYTRSRSRSYSYERDKKKRVDSNVSYNNSSYRYEQPFKASSVWSLFKFFLDKNSLSKDDFTILVWCFWNLDRVNFRSRFCSFLNFPKSFPVTNVINVHDNTRGTRVPSAVINAVTGVHPIQIKGTETDIKGVTLHMLHIGTGTASGKGKEIGIAKNGIISKTRGSLSFLETWVHILKFCVL